MPHKKKRRPSVSRKAQIAAVAVLGIALVCVLIGISVEQTSREEQAAAEASAYNARATIAAAEQAPAVPYSVIGDSITAGDSPSLADGRTGLGSWVTYAADGADFRGGWAQPGSTTDRMVENARASEVDVLVILAGTNDVAQGIPFERSADNLRTIVAETGTPRVVVSAIPPFDRDPAGAEAYNEALGGLAASEGWTFIDPMGPLRDEATYKDGMTEDGVHPTIEGARLIGEGILPAILG